MVKMTDDGCVERGGHCLWNEALGEEMSHVTDRPIAPDNGPRRV
jgi:hypothetical protein